MDKQTECFRVLTIGYIKEYISNYIQDASGDVVTVAEEYSNDKYCPTYDELTGGSVIQVHVEAEHPKNDVDGIFIVRKSYNDGLNYKSNQNVDQADFRIIYTRLTASTIDASLKIIEECNGTSTLSYIDRYRRRTKALNSSDDCDSVLTTSRNVNTTNGDDIAYSFTSSPVEGTISGNIYSITKNCEKGSVSRSATIKSTTIFRNQPYNSSNTVTITCSQQCEPECACGDIDITNVEQR